jgi:L-ascorbate metabolism protein UlaG (beta-lactamase superfamily)
VTAVHEALTWRPDALGGREGPDGIHVTWLGTAGFSIEHAGHVVLIDPYVTRAPLRAMVGRLTPDAPALARYVPRADAIIVGHTHFDHALDVPSIAKRTGALVFGSRSAAALCHLGGVAPETIDVVERDQGPPVEREVGPFRFRFIPSAHSRLVLGRVPWPGDIADCDEIPMGAQGYRCGAVFGVEIEVAGRRLYHMGSAELVDENIPPSRIDLLLMCVAGWTTAHKLPERAMQRLAPGAVLLSHWDNFCRPIDKPAQPFPAMQLPRLVDRLTRVSGGVKVGTVPILGDVWV